jgi:hypothetical protein
MEKLKFERTVEKQSTYFDNEDICRLVIIIKEIKNYF